VIFPRLLPTPVAVIFHFGLFIFLLFQFSGDACFAFRFPFRERSSVIFDSFSLRSSNAFWVSFRVSALITIQTSRDRDNNFFSEIYRSLYAVSKFALIELAFPFVYKKYRYFVY